MASTCGALLAVAAAGRRPVTHLCRLGVAQIKNGFWSMERAADTMGCSRDAVRPPVGRVAVRHTGGLGTKLGLGK